MGVWIGEIRGRYVKTVRIPASSRAEAMKKLHERSPDIETVDVVSTWSGAGRVIRKDTPGVAANTEGE